MKRFYSASTGCTYLEGIHDEMPADAQLLNEARYLTVIANPEPGKVRAHDNEGLPILIDPPAPSREQLMAAYVAEVQLHMDQAARSRGYDDIKTAVTYADEPSIPQFQAEGQEFRAWRSRCWAYCYTALSEVDRGVRPAPSAAELLAGLPAIELLA